MTRPYRKRDPSGSPYANQVAQAMQRARAAIAAGMPRHEAVRTHAVPLRLWSRV